MSKPRLSASKLKTLSNCSWLFYKTYGDPEFPKSTNSGSSRGSCVHYILECLLDQRRRPTVEAILLSGRAFSNPAVYRLARIHASKLDVADPENMAMIDDFIITALKNDFYCSGATKVIPEQKFEIDGPNYTIVGFRDVTAIYEDRILVRDFKCSKQKYNKEELNFNLQNYIYCLSMRKEYPHLPVELVFQFLKYKKDPNQPAPKVTDEELAGFEQFLEYSADYIKDFTPQKAVANLAKGDYKRSWLCGKIGEKDDGQTKFLCIHRHPRVYWTLKDENGKFLESSFDKIFLDKRMKLGYSIEMKTSKGCPAWKSEWESK